MNNPLKYTDPTGHFSISNAWNSFKSTVSKAVNTVKSFVSSALKPKPPVNAPLSTFVLPKSYTTPKTVASNNNSGSNNSSSNNSGTILSHAPKETSDVHRQVYNFVIGDDITTLSTPNSDVVQKTLAGISIIGNIYPPGKIAKFEKAKDASKMFDPDQAALIELAKEAKKTGVNVEDAQTLVDWSKEYNLPHHDIMSHPNRKYGQFPHINIGTQKHIFILE